MKKLIFIVGAWACIMASPLSLLAENDGGQIPPSYRYKGFSDDSGRPENPPSFTLRILPEKNYRWHTPKILPYPQGTYVRDIGAQFNDSPAFPALK